MTFHLPRFRRLLAAMACASVAACAAPPAVAPSPPAASTPPATPVSTRPPAVWEAQRFAGGVVSASHPLAARAGLEMLRRGGNAVDAAAAVQLMLNVVEPHYSGLGGGVLVLVHVAREGRTYAVDGRETAPAAASARQFSISGLAGRSRYVAASTSGVSVGVPGTLAALDLMLRRWGTMGLAEVTGPAADAAERGFIVNRWLAEDIADDAGRTALQPETAAVFRPGGVPLKAGDRLVQPALARTLRLIAREGTRPFYEGEIARAIVEAQQRSRTPIPSEGRGRMTTADLAGYRAVVREPLRLRYRGWQLAGMPPPSSGGLAVGQLLGLVERFPIGDVAQGYGFGSARTLHVMAEAMRLAFADRAVWMGDADAVPVPQAGLLHPQYLRARSALIDPARRMATPAAGDPRPFDPAWRGPRAALPAREPAEPARASHTTHFSVVDAAGNVVAFTGTIEAAWGTGILVPGWGFLLNNELTDFNLDPQADAGLPGANDVAPGKRPRSSMSPTLVLQDGRPVLAYGSPGGPTIINSVFNLTLNLADHGMGVQEAIDAPRLSVTAPDGTWACEGEEAFMQPRFAVAAQDTLRALGHPVPGPAGGDGCTRRIGSVQAVAIDLRTGRRWGGADRRREGSVVGLDAAAPLAAGPR